MPDGDGLILAKVLREKTDAGIVMLTGKGASVDVVVSLEVGADDYGTRPFKSRKLLARIRSVLRPTVPGWRFESAFQRLTNPQGQDTQSTAGKSWLLQTLIDNVGRTVDRDTLHREALGYVMQAGSRNIDVLIGRLRQKLNKYGTKESVIKSVRGVRYEFIGMIKRE